MSQPKAAFVPPQHEPLLKPVFDSEAIARADGAIAALSGEFEGWFQADVKRLQDARVAAEGESWRGTALDGLYRAAHELKGVGATYGYPLATQIAASLCSLLATDAGKAAVGADPGLALAHVDALRALARDKIKDDAHLVGAMLAETLAARVAALGVSPA